MKLLLTSAGLTNDTIKQALFDLAGKSGAELRAVFIPTAALCDDGNKDWMIDDMYRVRQAVGYVDVVDISQSSADFWRPRVEAADIIVVGGGNAYYLSYWMQKSGMMKLLPELLRTRVYMGISAGGMLLGDHLRVSTTALAKGIYQEHEYDDLGPAGQSSAQTAKLVDFVIRPHLNSRFFPKLTGDQVAQVAKDLQVPIYALDDQSAIKINGDDLQVITEGEWKLYD